MSDRNRGDSRIRDAHHDSLFGMIAFKEASQPRDWPSDVIVLQATEKLFGDFFFLWAQAREHFRDIDGTAG